MNCVISHLRGHLLFVEYLQIEMLCNMLIVMNVLSFYDEEEVYILLPNAR